MKIAVIGLGSMGYGVALSLIRAGHEVAGYDVSATALSRFAAEGGLEAASAGAAAAGAGIVITTVINADQTEEVLFGAAGVAKAVLPGAVFVSMATMAPDQAQALESQALKNGFLYLDAPMSGGSTRAASGELTIMASGSAAAFEKARPALSAIATTVYELGTAAGAGSAFKMINQMLAGIHIAAACEAITLAAKQKLDINKVYEVIKASAGNSWMFENRVPHILSGDYTPHSAVDIFVKDMGIVLDMARRERFPVPMSASALQMFLAASGSGFGKDDDASVARVYSRLSNSTLPTR